MKVKDLPLDTDLTKIKVKVSDEVLESFQEFCGGEQIMFIAGNIMGDFFMKSPIENNEGGYALFPLPEQFVPANILEWEVYQDN